MVAPAASAQPAALADLTASRFEGTGPTSLSGPAQAVVYRSAEDEDRVGFAMALEADRFHVSVDHAQSLVNAAGASVEGYLWTDDYNFSAASLGLDSARPHFKVEVLALAGRPLQASHETVCLSLAVPEIERVEVSKRTQSARPIPSVPTAETVEVGLCAGVLSVSGDFLLVLWEANVTVVSADEKLAIHTGEGFGEARGPEGAAAPAEVAQMDQAYIQVTGGRLRLQSEVGSGGDIQAFVRQGEASLDGLLRASNARGEIFGLAGERKPTSSEVEVEGTLSVQVQRQDSEILAHLFGEPSKLVVDGNPVQLATSQSTMVDADVPRSAALLSGMALLLVIAWGILYFRRRYPGEPLRLALALHQHQAGRHALALVLSRVLLRGRAKADGWALNARIHYDSQRWQDAFHWAVKADHFIGNPQHRAKNALLACFAAARLELPRDSGVWYRRAKQMDATLADAPELDEPLLVMTAFREFGTPTE